MTADHSSPCTFGIGWVGSMTGAAGLASTGTAGAEGATAGVSAGFAWTAADCCIGAGAGVSLSAMGFSTNGFSSARFNGAGFGVGTD